jgi:hypothetical protein
MTTVYLALSKIGTSLGTASAGSTTITNWMTAGGTFSKQVSNVVRILTPTVT